MRTVTDFGAPFLSATVMVAVPRLVLTVDEATHRLRVVARERERAEQVRRRATLRGGELELAEERRQRAAQLVGRGREEEALAIRRGLESREHPF